MTLKEITEILPKEYGDKILKQSRIRSSSNVYHLQNLHSTVMQAVHWKTSQEGSKYWSGLHWLLSSHETGCENKLL